MESSREWYTSARCTSKALPGGMLRQWPNDTQGLILYPDAWGQIIPRSCEQLTDADTMREHPSKQGRNLFILRKRGNCLVRSSILEASCPRPGFLPGFTGAVRCVYRSQFLSSLQSAEQNDNLAVQRKPCAKVAFAAFACALMPR